MNDTELMLFIALPIITFMSGMIVGQAITIRTIDKIFKRNGLNE